MPSSTCNLCEVILLSDVNINVFRQTVVLETFRHSDGRN